MQGFIKSFSWFSVYRIIVQMKCLYVLENCFPNLFSSSVFFWKLLGNNLLSSCSSCVSQFVVFNLCSFQISNVFASGHFYWHNRMDLMSHRYLTAEGTLDLVITHNLSVSSWLLTQLSEHHLTVFFSLL